MDYSKVYYQIIENAKAENRTKNDNIYYEEHHIIPRSLNGSDDENNKVLLTDKEHYICHKLLTYVYKGNRKMTCAFHFMTFSKKYGKLVSSRDYQYAKELLRKTPVSEETGIGLIENSVNEELNFLKTIAEKTGGLTPEQINKANQLP